MYNLIYTTQEVKNKQTKYNEVELLTELINCKSVTPESLECIEIIRDKLENIGFNCMIVECSNPQDVPVNNLYAVRAGIKPSLGFVIHADVVPPGEGWADDTPAFNATIKNAQIYGRGALDMKGEAAGVIAGISQVQTDREIHILVSGAEEAHSLNGMNMFSKYLADKGLLIDWGMTVEPTSEYEFGDIYKLGSRGNLDLIFDFANADSVLPMTEALVKSTPNCDIIPVGVRFGNTDAQYQVQILGKQGHSALPHRFVNPIKFFLDNAAKIDTKAQITGFNSGFIACNVVPPVAEVYLDTNDIEALRFLENNNLGIKILIKPNHKAQEFEPKACINVRMDKPWTADALASEITGRVDDSVKIGVFGAGEPYKVAYGEFAKKVEIAVKNEVGIDSKPVSGGFTSDTRFLLGAFKEIIDFGFVGSKDEGGMHGANECVPLKDVQAFTKIIGALVK